MLAPGDEGAPPHLPPPPSRLFSLDSLVVWFYFAAAGFVLALLFPHLLPSFPPMPPGLHRQNIICGVLKLDPFPDLFAAISRPEGVASPTHRVLILPGLAAGSFSFRRLYRSLTSRGLLAVVVDLPGHGFSPAPARAGALREMSRRALALLGLIVGAGGEPRSPYAPAEAAAAVARAVELLGLGPVHLVLHDSALAAGAAFASAHPRAVQSVTLIDATASTPAFPAAVLDVPVHRRLFLWVPPLFRGVMRRCCVPGMGAQDAEAHRAAMLMRGEGRVEGLVAAWKAMNRSFDLGEWRRSSEKVKKLPIMVLWSRTWSDWWKSEGDKVAAALPDAIFFHHSGGRWPQEDATKEISDLLTMYVTSFEGAAGGYIKQSIIWQPSNYENFKFVIMD